MHIRVIDGKASLYSVRQLISDNPNISFPEVLSEEFLAQWNVFPLRPSAPPAHNPVTQNIRMEIAFIDGAWSQSWAVSAASQAEIERRMADLSASVRADRDGRLAACDWVAIRSAETATTMPTEWVAYRQALRNITLQPSFPVRVVWPTKPD